MGWYRYHKIILRNGKIENGRPEFWQGAHVKGINHKSLEFVSLVEKFHIKAIFVIKKVTAVLEKKISIGYDKRT